MLFNALDMFHFQFSSSYTFFFVSTITFRFVLKGFLSPNEQVLKDCCIGQWETTRTNFASNDTRVFPPSNQRNALPKDV